MPQFFSPDAGWRAGLMFAQSLSDVRAQMIDRAYRLDWEEKKGPAIDEQFKAWRQPMLDAAAEAEAAKPGSPEEHAAHGKMMSAAARFSAQAMPILAQLASDPSPYAQRAAKAYTESMMGGVQTMMQYGAQVHQNEAEDARLGIEKQRLEGEQKVQQGQLEVQKGQLGLQQQELEQRGKLAPLEIQARTAEAQAATTRAQSEALQAKALPEELRQRGENLKLEGERLKQGKLGELAQVVTAVGAARAAGELSDEQTNAIFARAGVPAGKQDVQLWTKELESQMKQYQKIIDAEQAKPQPNRDRLRRAKEQLARIQKESDDLTDAQIDADERTARGERWWSPHLQALQQGVQEQADAERASGQMGP